MEIKDHVHSSKCLKVVIVIAMEELVRELVFLDLLGWKLSQVVFRKLSQW